MSLAICLRYLDDKLKLVEDNIKDARRKGWKDRLGKLEAERAALIETRWRTVSTPP